MATQFITLASLNQKTLNPVQTPPYKRKKPRSYTSQNGSCVDVFSDVTSETDPHKPTQHALLDSLHTKTLSHERLLDDERLTEDEKGKERKPEREKRGGWGREVARKSLWYMKSSISYILRKARAFYNEFCCDTYEDAKPTMQMMSGSKTMQMDPYFAIPVLPPDI